MATLKKMTRIGADVRQIARLLQAKAPENHILAYITPEEAELLKSRGGSGMPDLQTGIPTFEYDPEQYYSQPEAGTPVYLAEPSVTDLPPAPAPDYMQPYTTPVTLYGSASQLPQYSAVSSYPDIEPPMEGRGLSLRPSADYSLGAPIAGGGYYGSQPSAQLGMAAPSTDILSGYTPTLGGAYDVGLKQDVSFDTTPPAQRSIGERIDDLSKYLGISKDTLARLGIGGVQAVLGAKRAKDAAEQGRKAKEEQQRLAAPYQAKGAELQRQAQAGELTPAAQQQLQAVQAQVAQGAAARGGVGAAQTAAQIEAFRNQLLQNQYDYGLKLSGIGDQVALGAIRTGLEADRYVNQLSNTYFTNVARTLAGSPTVIQYGVPA